MESAPAPAPAYLIASAKRINRAMFFVGAALFIAGARFFIQPHALARTSVGRAVSGPWDDAWSAAFVASGLLIMLGLGLKRPRLELPGITLAAAATAVNGVAIFLTNGLAATSQLPLYALALWVFDGRRRDLLDLPRERRRHPTGDPRPPRSRVERRSLAIAAPFIFAAQGAGAGAGPSTATTLIVAILGGGIITALVQALMYRPQRRDLEGRLSDTAVSAAQKAIDASEKRADALEEDLEELRLRLDQTLVVVRGFKGLLEENGIDVPRELAVATARLGV